MNTLPKQMVSTIILYWLKFFAKIQLQKTHPIIIGVTGSVGKTSTVNAIEAVLKKFPNLKVTHEANSESGIPLQILSIKLESYSVGNWLKAMLLAPLTVILDWKPIDTYVIEMGIDSPNPPKNMQYLLSIVQPDVGVFLNSQVVHSQNFDALISQDIDQTRRSEEIKKAIANEKGHLIQSLPPGGQAILNLDDPNVSQFISKTRAQVITFGMSEHATISIVSITPSVSGTWIKLKHNDKMFDFVMPKMALTKSYGYSFASAIAVGMSQDLSIDEAIENLKINFRLPPGRMSIVSGINNSIILDSSYNSSQTPALEALDVLGQISAGKKYALLGDMNELGIEAKASHQLVVSRAQELCDHVYLVGPQMKEFILPVEGKITHLLNAKLAAQTLQNILKPNDSILIKGSQNGIFLEYAVEKLLKNPGLDGSTLCRRGEYWQSVRAREGLD